MCFEPENSKCFEKPLLPDPDNTGVGKEKNTICLFTGR